MEAPIFSRDPAIPAVLGGVGCLVHGSMTAVRDVWLERGAPAGCPWLASAMRLARVSSGLDGRLAGRGSPGPALSLWPVIFPATCSTCCSDWRRL